MQTLEYRNIDKSAWPDGPWQSEPDKRQWQDEATSLPCLLKRNPESGFLCGYVGVPPGHPAYEQDYSSVDVSCHGGLTYSDFCMDEEEPGKSICHIPAPGEPDRVWWLGFDCGHCYDSQPGLAQYGGALARICDHGEYRTVEYVVEECRQLAQQLAALKA